MPCNDPDEYLALLEATQARDWCPLFDKQIIRNSGERPESK